MDKERKYVFYTLSSEESIDNVRYIGATCKTLNERLYQHKYVARTPNKRSTPVSKWIYSLQLKNVNVIIQKIDECNQNDWENKERELILKYKKKFNLLNVDAGGKGSITIEKRNKSGLIRSAQAHEIKIVQLDLNGKYMKTFNSIKEATTEMGLVSKSAISNVLKGRAKTSCGSYWVYESDYLNNSYSLVSTTSSKELVGIKYYQYCIETHDLIKIFLSQGDVLHEILESSKSNSSALKKAILNKTNWHGYYWALEEVSDFSEFFDDDYKLLEIMKVENSLKIINKFKSNKEAACYFHLAESTISNYIRTGLKTKNNTYLIKNNKEIKI